MENEALLRKVKVLGYPLLEKEEGLDVNATLAEVVESHDLRLWEGFPLLVAGAAQKGLFDHEKVKERLKRTDKDCFSQLLLVSFVLYEALGLKFPWVKISSKALSYRKAEFDRMREKFEAGEELSVYGKALSPQRLKNTFSNYLREEEKRLSEFVSLKEEFSVEYALSQVFPPKQRELFFKRLKGEKLTKTEKEYYSRTVRKKVAALANPELHRMAQKIMS